MRIGAPALGTGLVDGVEDVDERDISSLAELQHRIGLDERGRRAERAEQGKDPTKAWPS